MTKKKNDEFKITGAEAVDQEAADPKQINAAKKDTRVVTTDELNFLLPIVAGKKVSKEDSEKAAELMKKPVTLGTIVQVASYMDNIVKLGLLSNLEDIIDTVSIHKAILDDTLPDESEKKAEEYYKNKKEMYEKQQEALKKAQEENIKGKPVKKTHKQKKAEVHQSNVVDMTRKTK